MSFPKANKDLGQHFLTSTHVIDKIVQDFKEHSDSILEIGPGPAVLTKHLALHQLPYHVIEMDSRFKELLQEHLPEENIHLGDALKINFQEIFSLYPKMDHLWLVSNLPYNVSSPLIIKFLPQEEIKMMTLMMQKEVAQKIVPPQNEKRPGSSLFSLCQNYFDIEVLVKAPPGAFSPPPKVDSLVLSFKRKQDPVIDVQEFKKFESFSRLLFSQKRKQMLGVLSKRYAKDLLLQTFEQGNLEPTQRSETLNLQAVQFLFKRLVCTE